MAIDERRRSELEAHVYSRAGAAEPRIARVDPATGRTIEATESEWLLLQASRSSGRRDAPVDVEAPELSTDHARSDVAPPKPLAGRTRRRGRGSWMTRPTAGLLGFALASALFGGWFWIDSTARTPPSVHLTIVPAPSAGSGATSSLPEDAAFDVFRDPDARTAMLPWWLMADFPMQHVVELVPSDGTIPGAAVYAGISRDTLACVVVRLEPNGMNWTCTSTEHVRLAGMTMRTAIPANLGSPRDDDGDGIWGDWSDTDLLTVEWHVDGSFAVSR